MARNFERKTFFISLGSETHESFRRHHLTDRRDTAVRQSPANSSPQGTAIDHQSKLTIELLATNVVWGLILEFETRMLRVVKCNETFLVYQEETWCSLALKTNCFLALVIVDVNIVIIEVGIVIVDFEFHGGSIHGRKVWYVVFEFVKLSLPTFANLCSFPSYLSQNARKNVLKSVLESVLELVGKKNIDKRY